MGPVVRKGTTGYPLCLLAGLVLLAQTFAASVPQTGLANYYQLLNVNKGASDVDIKRAYRRLSLDLHPDKVKARDGDAEEAERLFQQISHAYQVLSNKKSRQLFDTYGPLYATQESYYEQLGKTGQRELYLHREGVHLIHGANLDSVLRGSPFSWVVSFYQAGCGSCEQRVPFFTRLGALALETPNVRVAMVNCLMSNLCHFFGVSSLGQVLLFPPQQEGGDSWDYQTYEGAMHSESILRRAEKLTAVYLEETSSDSHVFQQLRKMPTGRGVGGISAAWVVDYYRPSCPPCRQLRSELRRLSRTLSEQIRITMINCDTGHCDVPHFPYLRLFIKRSNGKITIHSLPYGGGGHPGASAVQVVAFIFNTVLGLEPVPTPRLEEGGDGNQKDEL